MTSDRPLDPDELAQFEHYRQKGLALLGSSSSGAPKEVVQAINEYVDDWQTRRRGLMAILRRRGEDATATARALGVVWGDQIVRQFEWIWICETREADDLYAVAPTDRSMVIHAPQFIQACLENPKVDCTVALAFNMQAAGKFPSRRDREYLDVMSGVRRLVPKR